MFLLTILRTMTILFYLINDKEKIGKWLIESLSTSTSSNYALACRHAIESMDISEDVKAKAIRFYL